jgi:hypothetical protein
MNIVANIGYQQASTHWGNVCIHMPLKTVAVVKFVFARYQSTVVPGMKSCAPAQLRHRGNVASAHLSNK